MYISLESGADCATFGIRYDHVGYQDQSPLLEWRTNLTLYGKYGGEMEDWYSPKFATKKAAQSHAVKAAQSYLKKGWIPRPID